MKIIDRKNGQIINDVEDSAGIIRFLYHSLPGRIFLKLFFARVYFSKLLSIYYKSPLSKAKIESFVKKYNMDGRLLKRGFVSFDDFFTRKERINPDREGFIATASAKLRVFRIGENGELYQGKKRLNIMIKGNVYNTNKLLKSPLPKWARGGYLLLYRLSLSDYHRYIYPIRGRCKAKRSIDGHLESVRRDAAYWRAFAENKRVLEYWQSEYGKMLHMEIGAMLVGHIHNYEKKVFLRGEEKGYFSYGGSSIVEIVGKGVEIDKDILKNSEKGFETKVRIGERIGYGKTEKA